MSDIPSTSTSACHYASEVVEDSETVKKLLIQENTMELNLPIESHEQFYKLCEKYLDEDWAEVAKMQWTIKKKSKGKFSKTYKYHCLNFYFDAPKTYTLLQKALYLPSIKVLSGFCKPLTNALDTHFVKILKSKSEHLPPNLRHCAATIKVVELNRHLFYNIKADRIIGFHEMGHQKFAVAKYAVVVVLRGLADSWIQPLSYAFVEESQDYEYLNTWVVDIITIVLEAGLHVHGIVLELQPHSILKCISNKVSIEKPFFPIKSDDTSVFFFYDISSLITNLWNNFMKYDFYFSDGSIAKWEHLVQYYEFDVGKAVRLTPKLTIKHVTPDNNDKKNVKLAFQVFSLKVSGDLYVFAEANGIDPRAIETATFMGKMNSLFDLLNSSKRNAKNIFQKPYTECSLQLNFLKEMYRLFEGVRLKDKAGLDVTEEVEIRKAMMITIKSLTNLFSVIKEHLTDGFLTCRINFECFKEIFANEHKFKMTCQNVYTSFNNSFVQNLLRHVKSANDTVEIFLSKYIENKQAHLKGTIKRGIIGAKKVKVKREDYKNFNLIRENNIVHIAGFIFSRCFHECDIFSEFMAITTSQIDIYGNKIVFPPPNFIEWIQYLDNKFKIYFNEPNYHIRLIDSIIKTLDSNLEVFCPCFPVAYAQKLFFRIRLYFTLKQNCNRLKKENRLFTFVVNNLR